MLYRTMTVILIRLAQLGFPIVGLAARAVLLALLEWSRKSELSADRAGLLAVQNPEAALGTMLKLAGGGSREETDLNEFLRQADEYRQGGDVVDAVFKVLNLLGSTHPFHVLRVAEMRGLDRVGRVRPRPARRIPSPRRRRLLAVHRGPRGRHARLRRGREVDGRPVVDQWARPARSSATRLPAGSSGRNLNRHEDPYHRQRRSGARAALEAAPGCSRRGVLHHEGERRHRGPRDVAPPRPHGRGRTRRLGRVQRDRPDRRRPRGAARRGHRRTSSSAAASPSSARPAPPRRSSPPRPTPSRSWTAPACPTAAYRTFTELGGGGSVHPRDGRADRRQGLGPRRRARAPSSATTWTQPSTPRAPCSPAASSARRGARSSSRSTWRARSSRSSR